MAASQGDDCIVWIRLLAASALARSAVSSGHVIRDVRMSRDLTVVPSVDVLVHAIKFHLEQICTRQTHTHTHIHTRLTAFFPGLPGKAGTRKVKPIWILLKQETVSGSGISWAICKYARRSRRITTPAPTTQFLQTGCPSCRPTNSVKALKAKFKTRKQTDHLAIFAVPNH